VQVARKDCRDVFYLDQRSDKSRLEKQDAEQGYLISRAKHSPKPTSATQGAAVRKKDLAKSKREEEKWQAWLASSEG
jgi:hypothetical protein